MTTTTTTDVDPSEQSATEIGYEAFAALYAITPAEAQAAHTAVVEAGRGSTKVLQNAMHVGYSRAKVLVEYLEARGFIGPDRASRGREVLVDLDVNPSEAATGGLVAADAVGIGEDGPAATTLPSGFELVDPATLRTDVNIRVTRLDSDFVASVRDLGVLQPIVVVRTDEGALRARYGHRRTAAAVEAGHPTVPVVVVDAAGADDADRIVRQWAENEHRAGLTTQERVEVIEQLALLDLPASAIAKRTKLPRAQVDAALTVARTPAARVVVEAHPVVTIDQAAALASIEDTDEVERLVGLIEEYPEEFAYEMQGAVQEQQLQHEQAARRDELAAAGVRVLTDPPSHQTRSPIVDVAYLTDADGNDLIEHASCPGHAVYVGQKWDHERGTAAADDEVACTDWRGNGHRDRYARGSTTSSDTITVTRLPDDGIDDDVDTDAPDPDEQRRAAVAEAAAEKARQERRTVLDNNKAWRAAETVRRDWLRDQLAAKVPPNGTARFVAGELYRLTSWHNGLAHGVSNQNSNRLAQQLLGVNDPGHVTADLSNTIDSATDNRAQVIALAHLVGMHEAVLTVDAWRTPSQRTARYFEFLASLGHTLTDVEKLAAGQKPGRKAKGSSKSGGRA